ncbi:hypothetical protein TNCV_768581 [Trichonephila clavipes]|nr:hypothetical protein TNCV_768581 [Trichonephila clavipes]
MRTWNLQTFSTITWNRRPPNVTTPISPLPPTPVASPSHEPSQDAICESLPSMEQSTVPESPLKDLLPE